VSQVSLHHPVTHMHMHWFICHPPHETVLSICPVILRDTSKVIFRLTSTAL